jgi:pyroglutamyl-peptidase
MDILVTGFGPFPHVRVNPTTRLAQAVAKRLSGMGLTASALVLETSYAGGLPTLRRALAGTKPGAVLMLGLAARARFVRVELFGRGRASLLHPDVSGRAPTERATGASALPSRTTASAGSALACLRRAGIRARLSPLAGRYLCDASYALALREIGPAGTPVLFVHVPWLRPGAGGRPVGRVAGFRPGAAPLAAALAAIGGGLAKAGRNRRPTTAHPARHGA